MMENSTGSRIMCRWSLIAGRLPGRTANDVKNFWNTHIISNKSSGGGGGGERCSSNNNNIIRPRPRSLKLSKPVLVLPAQSSCNSDHEMEEWWSSLQLLSTKNLQPSTNHINLDAYAWIL